MNNDTKWKPLGYGVLAIFGLSLIPLLIYVVVFGSWNPSNNPQDWADFGEYLGGVLGPWLAFANILVLLRLTHLVAKFDESNLRNSIESQKYLSLTQLRHTAYKQIADRLYSLNEIVSDWKDLDRQLTVLQVDVLSFNSTMKHLFEGLCDPTNREPLEMGLHNVIIKLQTQEKAAPEVLDKSIEIIIDAYTDFVHARDLYLQMLQEHMLQNSIDHSR